MLSKTRSDFQKKSDHKLTAILNAQPLVRDFMVQEISRLQAKLAERFGDNVLFFLKGGNALNLLRGIKSNSNTPWSDWDIQLIINPTLPSYAWYELFIEVDQFLTEQLEGKWNETGVLSENGMQQRWLSSITGDTSICWSELSSEEMETIRKKLHSKFMDMTVLLFQDPEIHLEKQTNKKQVLCAKALHPGQLRENVRSIISSIPIPEGEVDRTALNQRRENIFDGLYPYSEEPTSSYADFGISMSLNYTMPEYYLYRMAIQFSHSESFIPQNKKSLRAELFDISILRRGNLTSLIQWNTIKKQLTFRGEDSRKLILPDYEYHYQENLDMVFETLGGSSLSPQKAMQRLVRAGEAMQTLVKEKKSVLEKKESNVVSNFHELTSMLNLMKGHVSETEYFALIDFLHGIQHDYEFEVDSFAKKRAVGVISDRLSRLLDNENDSVMKAMFEISRTLWDGMPRFSFVEALALAETIKAIGALKSKNIVFAGEFALGLLFEKFQSLKTIRRLEAFLMVENPVALEDIELKSDNPQFTLQKKTNVLYVLTEKQGIPTRETEDRLVCMITLLNGKNNELNSTLMKQGHRLYDQTEICNQLEQQMIHAHNFHVRNGFKRTLTWLQNQ